MLPNLSSFSELTVSVSMADVLVTVTVNSTSTVSELRFDAVFEIVGAAATSVISTTAKSSPQM